MGLWSYPNPFKDDGDEACDLIAIFENHIFLFFDRESKKFENTGRDILTQWKSWEKEVIKKQIKTSEGVEKYILRSSDGLYLDSKRKNKLPIKIPKGDIKIHRIIIAHGAENACKEFSKDNIHGSIAVAYGKKDSFSELPFPFMIQLNKDSPVHVFDSFNLEIILKELDTFYDFSKYLIEKEKAIKKYDSLVYCGEEDLLAHYYSNFESAESSHFIGMKDGVDGNIFIAEGEWQEFSNSKVYRKRQEEKKSSYYIWDRLLKKTCDHALNGELLESETGNIFTENNAIYEMAKEPRFVRTAFSKKVVETIRAIPEDWKDRPFRKMSCFKSFYPGTGYILLQFHHPGASEFDYRQMRRDMLDIACGTAKNKFPNFKKIIGIAIGAPKFGEENSEDFLFMDCAEWSDEQQKEYEEDNKILNFFECDSLKEEKMIMREFPRVD